MARHRKQVGKNGKTTRSESHSSEAEEPRSQHRILWKKIVGRLFLSGFMIFAVYWSSNREVEKVFAAQKETVKHRSQEIPCSKSYQKELNTFKGCAPRRCGRLVTDIIVSESEAAHLLQIARKGMAFGGSWGGASILDLHTGALSLGDAFINVYRKIKEFGKDKVFTEQDFLVYTNVRHKIQQMVAYNFGIEPGKLYLTHPTFFSEMTSRPAKSIHDEYWHMHIDKVTYPSFHYTSLLYLTDYGKDFSGGRFVFVEKPLNVTVEPRLGRVSAFTSGAENAHYVERVTSGTRYALTVSFTCDKEEAIGDPSYSNVR